MIPKNVEAKKKEIGMPRTCGGDPDLLTQETELTLYAPHLRG